MPYTSRSDAMEFACPFCGAAATEKCVGAKGRKRESVHRERMFAAAKALGHAEVRTLAVSGDRLVASDGTVIGRVVGLELDLQAENWEGVVGNLRRGEESGDVAVTPSEAKDKPSQGSAEGFGTVGQQALLEDPVEKVWDHYVKTLNRPKALLTPKVRRWISAAIQAVGDEQCKAAISGLAASEYHRTNGYIGIEYALVPKQGQTIEGRTEMMASKVGGVSSGETTVAQLLATVPSEAHDVVRGRMEKVHAMLRSERESAQRAGQTALQQLRDHPPHIEPTIENGRVVGWRRAR